ncbi:hypothetical protein QUA00_15075 [Microcoleus sp. T2B6]|uniref:hypothetical protein n=1 Tax=Microcoleus sp. T2B6 TaxID=3055424 RepID=UPI002FD0417C
MPVPQQTDKYFCGAGRLPAIVISSEQARCLFHNRQDKYFCGAGRLPAIVMFSEQARCLFGSALKERIE